METRKCFCGTLILSEWPDCGTPECMAQNEKLDAEVEDRAWRYKAIKQVLGHNRKARHETQKRVQEAAIQTERRIRKDLAHENLERLHRRMRREDSIPEPFEN